MSPFEVYLSCVASRRRMGQYYECNIVDTLGPVYLKEAGIVFAEYILCDGSKNPNSTEQLAAS